MASPVVQIDFMKIFSNLSSICFNVTEICNIVLTSGSSDVPQQLRQDIEYCLIPQTNQLQFIASLNMDPDKNQTRQLMSFIDNLYKQYVRVFSETAPYIRQLLRDNIGIQVILEDIEKLRMLSIQYQQQDSEPAALTEYVAQSEQILAQPEGSQEPPQPEPITCDDLPPRTDKTFMKNVYEKLCKAAKSMVEYLWKVWVNLRRSLIRQL